MSDDHNSIKEYKGILGQVTSPLIFFSLALLVIEGIIGITVVKSKLDAIQQFYMILVMAFLFLSVVGLVAWITVKYPLNLMDKEDFDFPPQRIDEGNFLGRQVVAVCDDPIGFATGRKTD